MPARRSGPAPPGDFDSELAAFLATDQGKRYLNPKFKAPADETALERTLRHLPIRPEAREELARSM